MKKGFTLIELLAVIVILAIIAIIATPIIINIIDDAKESSTLRSSELYMSAVELAIAQAGTDNIDITTCTVDNNNLKCGEKEYEIKIDGEVPEEVEIKADENGKLSAAMKTKGYCIIKREGEDGYSYKKLVDKVKDNNNEITNNMCALNPYTSETCFGFDESTGTITKYYSNENNDKIYPACPKDVVIPNKINGVDVKIIGNSSFQQQKIKGVVIPKRVTIIKSYAFYDNSILSLELPNGITAIGEYAFYSNSISSLKLPNSVTSIGGFSFGKNPIETLKLPEGYFTVAGNAFSGSKLKPEDAFIYKKNQDGSIDYTTIIAYAGAEKDNVIIPSEKNGVQLTTIANSAFQQHEIKGITIPEGVTNIGEFAFYNDSISSLKLPNTVTKIGQYAFHNNSISSLALPNSITSIGASSFYGNPIEILKLPEGYFTIGTSAFAGSKLKPEDAFIYKRNQDGSIDYTTIIAYAGAEKENVIIPSEKNGVQLTTIANSGFQNHRIKGITIPKGVTKIGQYAFYSNSITNLELPNSVTSIESNAFLSNPLETVTIKNKKDNVSISSNTFGSFDINNIVWDYVEE